MNGSTQLNDQIVSNSYLNCENNYSLNDSNLNSISECIESNEQQLAFDQWNKEYNKQYKDYKDLEETQHSNCNPFNDNFTQFNDFNDFNGINSNNNQTLINDSFINNDIINDINLYNNDNYLTLNSFNNNNTDNSNIIVNKSIVRKVSNKLSTNKKLSRKESSNSIVRNGKPVSAYALFFRDSQSVIKSSKPNATFGEISKVVAHNWEQLDKINKNFYKQRADQEKKNYLKSLASSRAKQIAGLMDQSSKSVFNSLQENSNQTDSNRHSLSVGFSNDNNSEINTNYDSTQQDSDINSGLGLRANESFADNNEQQLQQNIITTTENNSNVEAKQHCIRWGCVNDAIDSTEWDSEYCSSECCVKHCSDVFQDWVQKQQLTANNP